MMLNNLLSVSEADVMSTPRLSPQRHVSRQSSFSTSPERAGDTVALLSACDDSTLAVPRSPLRQVNAMTMNPSPSPSVLSRETSPVRTPPRAPSSARATPHTPPPGYIRVISNADDAEESFLLPSFSGTPSSIQAAVTPPRVTALERSQLLSQSAVSPVRPTTRTAMPATPPPTYPSPPEYNSPPRAANGDEVREYFLQPMGSSAVDYDDLIDTEMQELAPAYRDDVGFLPGVKRSGHLLCLLCTILLYTLIVLYVLHVIPWLDKSSRNFEVVLFAIYAVYVIEAFGCTTSNLLWNHVTASEAHAHFHKIMDAAPWVKWHLRSYHVRPGVNPAKATPKDQIVTYTKSALYPLQGCSDDTPLSFFTSHRLCTYQFVRERRWQDAAAEARYEALKEAFMEENKRDDFVAVEESWGIDEFMDGFLASRPGLPPPWWAQWRVFCFVTLLGFSFFYRTYFASRTGKQVIVFRKILF